MPGPAAVGGLRVPARPVAPSMQQRQRCPKDHPAPRPHRDACRHNHDHEDAQAAREQAVREPRDRMMILRGRQRCAPGSTRATACTRCPRATQPQIGAHDGKQEHHRHADEREAPDQQPRREPRSSGLSAAGLCALAESMLRRRLERCVSLASDSNAHPLASLPMKRGSSNARRDSGRRHYPCRSRARRCGDSAERLSAGWKRGGASSTFSRRSRRCASWLRS